MTSPKYPDPPDLKGLRNLAVVASYMAPLLSITPQRLGQLTAKGVLAPVPGSSPARYVVGDTLDAYHRHLRGGDDGTETLQDSKKRLTAAQARMAEMDADEREGLLVNAKEAGQAWTAAIMRMRLHLLAIPSKAAPLVAVETETPACHVIIEDMIYESLQELSEARVRSRGGDESADEGGTDESIEDGEAAS